MLTGKSSYFAAVAANGHGTPAAAACARIIVKEQTTVRIGAKPKKRAGAFGDNLRTGAGHRGEQPVKAALPCDEFDFPDAGLRHKFIVPFGDTQYSIKWLDPFAGYPLLSEHGREHLAQGRAEPLGLQQQCFCSSKVARPTAAGLI